MVPMKVKLAASWKRGERFFCGCCDPANLSRIRGERERERERDCPMRLVLAVCWVSQVPTGQD